MDGEALHAPFFLSPDVGKLEEALGMPPGFMNRLSEEDDWSFVVKSHALIESSLNYLLRTQTDPRAKEIFENLPLQGSRASKIEFLKRICRLDAGVYVFVQQFSRIRNALLHDIKNVDFRLADYLTRLDPQPRKQLILALTDVLNVPADTISRDERIEFFMAHTREVLILCVTSVVSAAFFAAHPDEIERAWQRLAKPASLVLILLFLALTKKPAE